MNVTGPPEIAAECVPVTVHWIANHEPVTFTGSLKSSEMFAYAGTLRAPAVGKEVITLGEESRDARGFGSPIVKSATLLLVSIAPSPLRSAAVVLDRAAVGAPSKQLALPYPTRSTIAGFAGQAPESAVVE